jgi:thioredoxin-dependent peroxiredoxin
MTSLRSIAGRVSALVAAFALASAVAAEAPKNFTVKSATGGKDFKLSEAKGGYVAVHFLLKTECPVCLRHTHTYLERAKELPDVKQVFLKPDTDEEIRKWARDVDKSVPIYRDPEAALAKTYGIPDGYKFHGQVVHYPALILIGPDGTEAFRYVGKNNGDRFSFDDLAKKLAELKKAAMAKP